MSKNATYHLYEMEAGKVSLLTPDKQQGSLKITYRGPLHLPEKPGKEDVFFHAGAVWSCHNCCFAPKGRINVWAWKAIPKARWEEKANSYIPVVDEVGRPELVEGPEDKSEGTDHQLKKVD